MEDTQNAQKQKQGELQGPFRGDFFSSVDHIHRQTGAAAAAATSNKKGRREDYVEEVNIPKSKAKDEDDDDEANHCSASLQGKFDYLLLDSFRMGPKTGPPKRLEAARPGLDFLAG